MTPAAGDSGNGPSFDLPAAGLPMRALPHSLAEAVANGWPVSNARTLNLLFVCHTLRC
jgi:hypothetical protein